MPTVMRIAALMMIASVVAGCQPRDQIPGLWLRGEVATALPQDWSFTDKLKEIYVEVATPYRIPHSVTIWCAQVNGTLYIGARDPETKHWPGWIAEHPDVRLKIGDTIYEVTTAVMTDEALLVAVRAAYATKYNIEPSADGKPRNVRYWEVRARG